MLVAKRALVPILAELDAVVAACAALAREHRGTVMAGRTLMQQAVPVTFGLKAAGWLAGVSGARARLRELRLPAQLGGAAGTLSKLGDRGPVVLVAFARELELDEPLLPWHGDRRPVAELGAALAIAAGAVEKVALDIVLLAQTEVAEVAEASEGGRGGSSAMAHKHNPVGAIRARAAARSVRAAAGVLLEAMAGEHERAAGAWHSEWRALTDALAGTGGAAWSLHEALDGLTVDPERMRANLSDDLRGESTGAAECVHRPGAGAGMSVRVHHRLEGPEGAPVVMFSNSLGTTLEMWDDQAAALADRYRVLRFDTRGHGRSPVPPGPYTVDDLADDALELLDQLGIERVAFCGLSLGGAIGMTLALKAPERLERLVLCLHGAGVRPARAAGTTARRPSAPRAWTRSPRPGWSAGSPPPPHPRSSRGSTRCCAHSPWMATPPAARRSPRSTCAGGWAASTCRR